MKIGIITMHKVLNYGSALQAYALQRMVSGLGYDCELIDYCATNTSSCKPSIKQKFMQFVKDAIIGFADIRKRNRFKHFYEEFFVESLKQYNPKTIKKDVPVYDVYMVGSDQVWNPRHIHGNSDFLLGFAPDNSLRVSYASSFATSSISDHYKSLYAEHLKKFDTITVREQQGCEIVRELTGKESCAVCDPVLLLEKDDWATLSKIGKGVRHKPYILVYILGYMFNPYPYVDDIVEKVRKLLGLRIVYLVGRKKDFFRPHSHLDRDSGPLEFLHLIQNASMVITSSFHGAAFSVVLGRPLLCVVKDKNENGDRLVSLMKEIGCEMSLVNYNEDVNFDTCHIEDYRCREANLKKYRDYSRGVLSAMLQKCENEINNSTNGL